MPVILITIWWFFWLSLSLFSIYGMDRPSLYTYGLILFGLVSFISAAKLSQRLRYNVIRLRRIIKSVDSHQIIKYGLIIIVPYILYYFNKSLKLLFSGDLTYYRELIFGFEDNFLLMSEISLVIYSLLIKPLLLIFYVYSVVLYFRNYKKSKWYFSLAIVLIVIDSIMFLSRFNLLYLVLVPFLYLSIYRYKKILVLVRKILSFKYLKYALLIILVFNVISITTGKGQWGTESFLRTITNYHTLSFTLLDKEIHNEHSRLNSKLSLGRASLGNIEKVSVFFLQKMRLDVNSIPGRNGGYLREFRKVGNNERGQRIESNAFASIFYSMYMDGRLIGVFLVSIFLGFLLGRNYKYSLIYSDPKYKMLTVLIVFYFFIGIYTPVLDGHFLMNYIILRYIL